MAVLALTAVLLATPYIATAYAAAPMSVLFGVPFDTFGSDLPVLRQAGKSNNWFSYANTYGEVIGDIEGSMDADARWIFHDWIGPILDPGFTEVGHSNAHILLYIDATKLMEATVTGTIILKFTYPGCTWTMYGSTDDLTSLHGQGTWSDGFIDGRYCQIFEGQIHLNL